MITTKSPASISDLRSVPLTTPAHAQGRWQGIAHGELVEAFNRSLQERGWTTAGFRACLNASGSGMAGSWPTLRSEKAWPLKSIDDFSIGVVNSNDWRTLSSALRCYAGVTLGGISIPLLRITMGRHEKSFDLAAAVEETLNETDQFFSRIGKVLRPLQEKSLRSEKAHELLWAAGEGKLLPWSRIGLVNRDYKNSPQTAWGLLFAFAWTARLNPPMKQMESVYRFYESLR